MLHVLHVVRFSLCVWWGWEDTTHISFSLWLQVGGGHEWLSWDWEAQLRRAFYLSLNESGKRERGIPSQLYNWKHSTEMCLPHLTQLWNREVREAPLTQHPHLRWNSGLTALLRGRTTDVDLNSVCTYIYKQRFVCVLVRFERSATWTRIRSRKASTPMRSPRWDPTL